MARLTAGQRVVCASVSEGVEVRSAAGYLDRAGVPAGGGRQHAELVRKSVAEARFVAGCEPGQ